jgi:hypothetical protein
MSRPKSQQKKYEESLVLALTCGATVEDFDYGDAR